MELKRTHLGYPTLVFLILLGLLWLLHQGSWPLGWKKSITGYGDDLLALPLILGGLVILRGFLFSPLK